MTTIHDIAKVSGFNAATVSRALSGKAGVKAQTKEIILRVAKQLDYQPNYIAKQLKTKKSWNVAVFINIAKGQALNNYFFNNILNSFFVVMEDKGYDVTFVTKDIAKNKDVLSFCRSRMFDGIFAVNADFSLRGMVDLINSDLPVVVAESVNAIPTNYPVVSVTSNNRQSMFELVSHVIAMGHKKLAYITGDPSYVTDERLCGYKQALAENGLTFDESCIYQSHYSVLPSVTNAINQLLDSGNLPTAIFAPDDYSSIAIFDALYRRGLKVPQDISIIGFDGIELGQNMSPRLTTVKQDNVAIGTIAGKTLIDLMEKTREKAYQSIIVDTKLIEGQSVADLKS